MPLRPTCSTNKRSGHSSSELSQLQPKQRDVPLLETSSWSLALVVKCSLQRERDNCKVVRVAGWQLHASLPKKCSESPCETTPCLKLVPCRTARKHLSNNLYPAAHNVKLPRHGMCCRRRLTPRLHTTQCDIISKRKLASVA